MITVNLDPANHLRELIARQLNVKEIELKLGCEFSVELDTKLTPELEAEGYARELARKIQAERKNRGLKKTDAIILEVSTTVELRKMLESQLSFLEERTNAKSLNLVDKIKNKNVILSTIKGKKIEFAFD